MLNTDTRGPTMSTATAVIEWQGSYTVKEVLSAIERGLPMLALTEPYDPAEGWLWIGTETTFRAVGGNGWSAGSPVDCRPLEAAERDALDAQAHELADWDDLPETELDRLYDDMDASRRTESDRLHEECRAAALFG
jgi:hypothetical protein